MEYIIKVNVFALALLGIYALLLRGKAAHKWSRAYLLIAGVLPFVLPLLKWPKALTNTATYQDNIAIMLPEVTIAPNAALSNDFQPSILFVYCCIASLLFVIFIFRLIKLYRFIRRQRFQYFGKYALALNTGAAPGSFMHYIFFPNATIDEAILQHEIAHIAHGHSYDKLFMMLLQCFGFFNLPLLLINKELMAVQEFQADEKAKRYDSDYALLLLSQHFSTRNKLSHTFFTHPLKRRIMMLQNNKNIGWLQKSGIVLATNALLLIAVTAQSKSAAFMKALQNTPIVSEISNALAVQSETPKSFSEETLTQETPSFAAQENVAVEKADLQMSLPAQETPTDILPEPQNHVAQNAEDEIFKSVEKMPRASYEVGDYLRANLSYPKEGRDKKIQGRVYVQFVIEKDGSITNAKVVKNGFADNPAVSAALSQEFADIAVNAVKGMPNWTPGMQNGEVKRVYFTVPINFSVQ